jgi:fructose-bisphosphate aldolase class I
MSVITTLASTLGELTKGDKGILAADESYLTLQKRFTDLKVEYTAEMRRAYRALLCTTPELEAYISGVILFEETLTQTNHDNQTFPNVLRRKGILTGIKVDQGLVDLPFNHQEKITQGLDGLVERLNAYYESGARFAKWRAVFTIENNTLPSSQAIEANAEVLACYAACCQKQAILPIIEPEVLRKGPHSLEKCQAVTQKVLQTVFQALYKHHVLLEYLILKPNMVTAGSQHTETPSDIATVAQATLTTLLRTVPAAVPSINFLSGGQSPEQATVHLQAINHVPGHKPWRLNFSYGRALQAGALQIWQGRADNTEAAQEALYQCAQRNFQAARSLR